MIARSGQCRDFIARRRNTPPKANVETTLRDKNTHTNPTPTAITPIEFLTLPLRTELSSEASTLALSPIQNVRVDSKTVRSQPLVVQAVAPASTSAWTQTLVSAASQAILLSTSVNTNVRQHWIAGDQARLPPPIVKVHDNSLIQFSPLVPGRKK